MSEKSKYTLSSGNVFADLGLPDAEELLAKADLAIQISRAIEQCKLTQAEAAEMLGIDQPKISALMRGRLSGFSMERLYRFLNALGRDVEIVVRPAARKRAGVRVVAASRSRKTVHQGEKQKTKISKTAAKAGKKTRTTA
jgi:predicted XRE-type DNA-binding protein